MNRIPATLILSLVLLLGSVAGSHAQLVVYKLNFDQAGETINYRPYQGGYYVAPVNGGTGSLILTLTTGGVKNYFIEQEQVNGWDAMVKGAAYLKTLTV